MLEDFLYDVSEVPVVKTHCGHECSLGHIRIPADHKLCNERHIQTIRQVGYMHDRDFRAEVGEWQRWESGRGGGVAEVGEWQM